MAGKEELNLNQGSDSGEPSRKGGGRGRLLLWIGLALLLPGAGAGAAWFFLGGGGESSAAPEVTATAEEEKKEEREAVYHDLGRFLVNFDYKGGIRYVQTEMQLMAYDADIIDKAERNQPAVRNRVIMLLSGQDFDALRTVEGKEQLRQDALVAVNDTLDASGKDAVQEVYFTAFVLQ